MNEIVRSAEASVSSIPSSNAMLNLFERLATNPDLPMDRIRELMVMQREMRADAAKDAFATAMAAAQSQMRAVVADKHNSQTRSRYASYAALDNAVRPIYTKHGLFVTFDTEEAPGKPDHIRIVADVSGHGHERRHHLDMPADGKGAKGGDVMTKTHAVMSAASYGKRGLLILIFNIPVTDRWDDDGNAAGATQAEAKPTITEDQVEQLRSALRFRDVPEDRALKRFRVGALEEIYAVDFDVCLKIAQAVGARQ